MTEDTTGERIVDTREAGTAGCAGLAMNAFEALEPGTAFTLVADHDPRALGYLFAAERAGVSTWEPLSDGPDLWTVRVGRTAD